MADPVNHPSHYTSHPSGVECIRITECLNFCIGNAMKYLWRAGLKGDAITDLEKARWYIDREIARLRDLEAKSGHVKPVVDVSKSLRDLILTAKEQAARDRCYTPDQGGL